MFAETLSIPTMFVRVYRVRFPCHSVLIKTHPAHITDFERFMQRYVIFAKTLLNAVAFHLDVSIRVFESLRPVVSLSLDDIATTAP